MPRRASEPVAMVARHVTGVRRHVERAAANPLVLSAVAGGLVLIAIAIDLAARAGSVCFLVLFYVHARPAREVS